jgi:DNA adenine methylase
MQKLFENPKIFLENKKSFLLSIQGSKNKYKRVTLSPLRYAGGKSLAVGYIIEKLPEIKRLVSPFLGGASIEIAINQKLGVEIIACDILKPLVIYWQQQIKNPEQLANELLQIDPTKENYQVIKKRLKEYWENKIKMTDLEIATLYYFNHNLSYGPSFLGWASSIYLNKGRYSKIVEKVRNFKVEADFQVSCCSFEEMFEKYPDDFFYCDPPYILKDDCDNSKMFAGIYPQRNFPIHHKGFDHQKLSRLLNRHSGGFILSYNNCRASRDLYKDYKMEYPQWQYTMGQGETRISYNRLENTHIKKSHEILIYC